MNNSIIEIQGLSKSFGKRRVIDDINLVVEKGDIYGFLGQNGSGKTTTIRMMLNLILPDKGQIKLNGFDLHSNFHDAIKKVGAVVESPKFYPYLSGIKNLQLMANLIPDISESRVEQVLKMVGMLNRAEDKVKTYSLGMKQRLGIANALLNDPAIVILDEPTNGLDPQGMKEIRDIIKNLSVTKGISFFISTHLLHEVEMICNKVAILHKGKIAAQGKVEELLNLRDELVDLYTKDIDKTIDLINQLEYVKSAEKVNNFIQVQLNSGFSPELNNFLVNNNINVKYIIPHHQSLEEFFITAVKGGNQID